MNTRSKQEVVQLAASSLTAALAPFDSATQLETAAWVFKAIGEPLRLQILCALTDGERCVQDLVAVVGSSHSNVSRHLAVLQQSGVLDRRRDASKVYYRIADERIPGLMALVREIFCSPRK